MNIVKQSATLEWITSDALGVIERAGRTCYQSEPKGDAEGFVRGIIDRGHLSVLEHASASFRLVVDRGISHEIVRHRLASYSQESTRYCNYAGKGIVVIEPPDLGPLPKADWEYAVKTAEAKYMALISGGVSPQIARSVLPTCLKTEIVMTANFREWLLILKLRLSKAAHPQIREVMEYVLDILAYECPCIFRHSDYSDV